ncbi:tetratricopeptide repeat protein [Stratiformator vulcanicus]|uniref:Tetratricopeptide repeat protein n=1 Tax=Stratiformator vulcanicus TaxID=2527980 RepID=A0A517QZW6_9PLAN|nr:tetratricopeptide repeat protein [Stratiformator vulcanicus]QDT37196.1 Tetratricopeptide repeat protein [Stratiformator vulcanicus]
MAQDKKSIAANCFKHGNEAMSKENWDYAIDMFTQCATLIPDNLIYRQSLRFAEQRKYGDNKTGARFAGPKLMGIRGKIKRAKMKKNWDALDLEAEKALRLNPWDEGFNSDVAQAAEERGYEEVAIFSLEKSLEVDGENLGYLRRLANLLEERGDYNRAQSVWNKVVKIDPDDQNARRKGVALASTKMIEGTLGSATSSRNTQPKTAYDAADAGDGADTDSPPDIDGPGQSYEADMLRAMKKKPDDRDLKTKLADYYRREDRLEEAAKLYKEAAQMSGDQNIAEQYEDTRLEQMRKNIEVAEEQLKTEEDKEAARKKVTALKAELAKREISIFAARVERYPQNSRIKFDLAKRYMMFKKWEQAIPLLQRASADNRIEPDARVLLGECFVNDGKQALALKQFEKALSLINEHDEEGLYLKSHYVLGRLAEDADDRDKAEDHYSQVLAIEYDYRDARKRLENLQAKA